MKTILRDTHSLDAAGVDNISEQIADVLADYPYITKRDILRLRLGAEEILLHWRQEVGELRVELSIEEKGRWVDLMLQMDGVPYRADTTGRGRGLRGQRRGEHAGQSGHRLDLSV